MSDGLFDEKMCILIGTFGSGAQHHAHIHSFSRAALVATDSRLASVNGDSAHHCSVNWI